MIPKKPPPHRRGIGADRPLGGGSSNLADAASHLLGLAAGTGSSLPSDGADAASHLLCLAAGKGSSLPFDGVDSPGGDDDLFNYSGDSNEDDDGSTGMSKRCARYALFLLPLVFSAHSHVVC